ncbi:MAG: isocitrate/isopropylmalate dehydrogenase family protein [Candidatus Tectomicrobia bacterium]|uniref:3-isopropylmalate dehydrogenase n=1 Tax=Tectimicrobiota bacterium TaxID=2528274 RepID=A0A932MNY6_UNCTE|nr:isocitrate/isopropylmalate dehydrogenase family protein [Candidatus Tectomicrobia bacterium]
MAKVAVIRGDGIGQEVVPEAEQTIQAAAEAAGFPVEFTQLDWGSERYLREGRAMPEDGCETLKKFDAILHGAVGGHPKVKGPVVQEHILLGIRFGLDLYANIRPCRLYHEDLSPLKGKKAGDIDHVVFRENTEGLFVNVGGFFKQGTKDEVALQEEIHTYKGVERVIRSAFVFAQRHNRKKVTMADKASGLRYAGGIWRRVFEEVRADFPGVESEAKHIDAVAMELIQHPGHFDVMVTNNMYGDILSDITSGLVGGLGLAPSANLNLETTCFFEPVHGTAPDIAGRGIANPMAAILTGALMLDHLGCLKGGEAIRRAVEEAIAAGERTGDLGGKLNTRAVGEAVRKKVRV